MCLNCKLLNAFLLLAVTAIAALQFGLLPLVWHPHRVASCLIVVMAVITEPLHYGLMHETIHGKLFRGEGWNRAAGRILGVFLGLPWETMRFGHLAHHSANRHGYDRPESFVPGQGRALAAIVYYFKLLIGNALSYAVLPMPALLPVRTTKWVLDRLAPQEDGAASDQLRSAALRAFTNIRRRNATRADILAIIAMFAVAGFAWRAEWPVFAICIAARWSVLSLLDNAPHYGMPLDSGADARNTTLPGWAKLLVLNGNYHGVHHRWPQLCWQELPQGFARHGAVAEGSWAAAVLRQFAGPVHLAGHDRTPASHAS